jgi:hypothetical protein
LPSDMLAQRAWVQLTRNRIASIRASVKLTLMHVQQLDNWVPSMYCDHNRSHATQDGQEAWSELALKPRARGDVSRRAIDSIAGHALWRQVDSQMHVAVVYPGGETIPKLPYAQRCNSRPTVSVAGLGLRVGASMWMVYESELGQSGVFVGSDEAANVAQQQQSQRDSAPGRSMQ